VVVALVVGLAGGLGAVSRYLLDGAVQDRTEGLFPFGTLSVNAIGSLVIGLVAGLVLRHGCPANLELIVGTGFCGGLTTWSTAAWESVRLAEETGLVAAARYTVANLATSLTAAATGLLVVWF
jgi:fluoride exporter